MPMDNLLLILYVFWPFAGGLHISYQTFLGKSMCKKYIKHTFKVQSYMSDGG
jgi:hypothetical protein